MIKKGTKLLELLNEEQKEKYLKEKQAKKLEQSNGQKILRRFANKIKELGFVRTKPTFFVRDRDYTLEFIHVHKFSFGPYYRIHVCIRVKNDSRDFIALQGPIDKELLSGVTFEFDENEGSIELCASKMAFFVKEEAEEWYENWQDVNCLLEDTSPLGDSEKDSLKDALEGKNDLDRVKLSMGLLKIV
ncbi:hypothetical protein [Aliikangiella sp. IMCC44632]